MEKNRLTHIDESGKARMVDISHKKRVLRTAQAEGCIRLDPKTIELIRKNEIRKGDVLPTARIAGIMGAKQTGNMIPLCHNIEIDFIDISFSIGEDFIRISSLVKCVDKTGIEMEALTAVSVSALAIWDMCKAVDDTMRIGDIRLIRKTKQPVGEPS